MRNPLIISSRPVWLSLASALLISVAPLPAMGQAVETEVALFGTNNPDLLVPPTAGQLNQPDFLNEPVIEPSAVVECDPALLLKSETCPVAPDAVELVLDAAPKTAVSPKAVAPIQAPKPVLASRVALAPAAPPAVVIVGEPYNNEALEEYRPVAPVSLLVGADDSASFLPPNDVVETSGLAEGVDFRPYASLRGGVNFDNGGNRNFIYQTEFGVDLDIYSAPGQSTLKSTLLLGKEPTEQFIFTSFQNAFSGQYDLSNLTRIDVTARFDIERESLGDEDLPTNTFKAPIFVTGAVTAALSHQFDQFMLTPNATLERVGYGKTELTNGTELTNESRQYWRGEIGLRARYDLTPRLAAIGGVFIDGTWFDANDPVTGLTRDKSSVGLRAGIEADWTDHLKAGAGVTVTAETYRDGSPNGAANWLFDGFLTYQPNQDLTISATASSQVLPSEVSGSKAQVVRKLGLQTSYLATQDVTIRTLVEGEHSTFVGPDSTTATVKVGAGLDYLWSEHLTGTLDVSADWSRDASNAVTNEQEIMVGVTVRP